MTHDARHRAGFLLAVSLLVLAWTPPSGAQDPKMSPARRPPTPQQAALKALDESWPDHPEWLDEYTDILNDTGLGPNDGWHRRALSQTRFPWKAAADRFDRDGDGRVARKEFPGTDRDFARLDRDSDGDLTRADFEFPPNSALNQSPGTLMMYVLDEDGNGKLTREEFEAFFKKSDSGGLDFLSLNDLQENFTTKTKVSANPVAGPPSKETLIRGLFKQEIGSLKPGPSLDEKAPNFTLKTLDGKDEVTLSKLVGPKPVVLVFGNFTCGPFRNQAGTIEKLHRLYKDRANFVMVYVREAHPTDGWRMDSNDQVGITTAQPRTYEERVAVAQACGKRLKIGFPMLVDGIDDPVGVNYSGMPSRLYLIDGEGKVAYKSGRGPYGFLPSELEHSLIMLLQQPAAEGKTDENRTRAAAPRREGPLRMLSNEDAWKRLPAVIEGGHPTLPNWALATANDLPRTTAAMIDLDRIHRTRSPLGPLLRGKMRWAASDANLCDYSRITAEADLRRAGMKDDAIADLKKGPDGWPEADRAAMMFARRMTLDAGAVTDDEVKKIKDAYGDEKLVAMVQLLAAANFQDRLLLSLHTPIEEGGPLPPLAVTFDKTSIPPVPPRDDPSRRKGPDVPTKVDDPEWTAEVFDDLQDNLTAQRSTPGRIRVPTYEEMLAKLPEGALRPKSPTRIKWSLVCMGYQPELAMAWSACTNAFREEAKQDRVFEESQFWVVTRTIHCFY